MSRVVVFLPYLGHDPRLGRTTVRIFDQGEWYGEDRGSKRGDGRTSVVEKEEGLCVPVGGGRSTPDGTEAVAYLAADFPRDFYESFR